jgi:hypothetical protein
MYRQTELFSDIGGGGHMPDAQVEQLTAAFDVAALLYVSGGVLVRVMMDEGLTGRYA